MTEWTNVPSCKLGGLCLRRFESPGRSIRYKMIYNNFIKELDIDIDYEHLRKIALVPNKNSNPNMRPHHRLVSENKYLSRIRSFLPQLSPVYNVLRLKPGQEFITHIDADRFCALNLPLSGTENSYTTFYKFVGAPVIEYDDMRISYNVKSEIEEVFRFSLNKPTIINNGDRCHPHGVVRDMSTERIIISWSFLKNTTYEDACNLFNDDVVNEIKLSTRSLV